MPLRGNVGGSRIARWLVAAVAALAGVACGDADTASGQCACEGEICPAERCNITFDLPASCEERFDAAEVLVDGVAVGIATPGESFATCTTTVREGETADVQVRASEGFESPTVHAACDPPGQPAVAGFCSLRFDLAESCRGVADEGVVVVDGVELGTTRVDEPAVPCVLVAEGDDVSGTIRAGAFVLTAPLRCLVGGTQPRLTMECPR